ncbi:MAG: serine/threonine protein kinase, partial [Planctomycetaceae bacterium]|nr:serine/threonine protein kinase [Planctomycetaceae bacterium]
PELGDLLDCLDSLDSLALPTTNGTVSGGAISPDVAETFIATEAELVRHDATAASLGGRTEFGRYELLEEIGRGGMGIVYRARQRALGSIVALKLVRWSRFASPDELRRFASEARAAAGLRHPNIVAVHDVGECFGQHYLAMDFVESGSLADRLAEGALDPREAAELLVTIARAVEYLHQHKIVHRDLKPANILLDRQGIPYVTDFGLAKIFEGDGTETASGTIIGTPRYMAPEQAAGKCSDVSPRSDIYSLGAILYEMLTGRPPFVAENPLDTLLLVLEAAPEPLRKWSSRVPRDLEAVCLRCLEKDPQDRFTSAAELVQQLEHFIKEEPVQLPPSSFVQRIQRWARREPALTSRLGVLSAAILIVQAYYQFGGHDDLTQHLEVMGLLMLWGVASVVFQRLSNHAEWEHFVPYGWAVADAACYTAVLMLADGPLGPVLIGYPVLIAGAGLWAEVKLVWFMTAVTTASYSVLAVVRHEAGTPWHYPLIFALALVGTGSIVAYQVKRLRSLTRYFERQRN